MKKKPGRLAKPTAQQVDSFVKLKRLKDDANYLKASEGILQLEEQLRLAEERFVQAKRAYEPDLPQKVPEPNPKVRRRRREYHAAEGEYLKTLEALGREQATVCQKFGLFQWWNPNAPLTLGDASDLFDPTPPVQVIAPEPKGRMKSFTKADRDGYLTLKVDLKVPLERSEPLIAMLLRLHRTALTLPKTRRRPDKDAEALQVVECYSEEPNFSTVARRLSRSPSTVKGQFIRGHVLIYGVRPSGGIKERRASPIKDPAREFDTHYTGCAKCRKAEKPEELCPRWVAWVTQDTKALREQLSSNPIQ